MSTAAVTAAPKVSLWSKIKHVLSVGQAVEENIVLESLPDLQKYAPVAAKMASDILTAQVYMQASIAGIPKGVTKGQKAALVVGVIGSQVIADAALLGKSLSTANVNVMNELIEQFQGVIANAPELTTAPTLAQVTTAETAAGITEASAAPPTNPAPVVLAQVPVVHANQTS